MYVIRAHEFELPVRTGVKVDRLSKVGGARDSHPITTGLIFRYPSTTTFLFMIGAS
jgi:hypothetical protein